MISHTQNHADYLQSVPVFPSPSAFRSPLVVFLPFMFTGLQFPGFASQLLLSKDTFVTLQSSNTSLGAEKDTNIFATAPEISSLAFHIMQGHGWLVPVYHTWLGPSHLSDLKASQDRQHLLVHNMVQGITVLFLELPSFHNLLHGK